MVVAPETITETLSARRTLLVVSALRCAVGVIAMESSRTRESWSVMQSSTLRSAKG